MLRSNNVDNNNVSTQRPILTDIIKQAVNVYKAKDFNALKKLWDEYKNNSNDAERKFLHYLMAAAHLFLVKPEERNYLTAYLLLSYAGGQILLSDTYNYNDVASYMELIGGPTALLTEREQRILFSITMEGFCLDAIVRDNKQAWLNEPKSTSFRDLTNDFIFVFKDKETAAFLLEDPRIRQIFKEIKLDILAHEPKIFPDAYVMFILGYLYENGNNDLNIGKDPQKAAAYYKVAMSAEHNHRHPEVACISGKAVMQGKDFDRAINLFESAFSQMLLGRHPEAALLLTSAYLEKAKILKEKGDHKAANKLFRDAKTCYQFALNTPVYYYRHLAKVTFKEEQFNNAVDNKITSVSQQLTNVGITQEWRGTTNNATASNIPQNSANNTTTIQLK